MKYLILVIILFWSTACQAAIYHVDCKDTIGQVNSMELVPGDRVLFERGCKYKDSSLLPQSGVTYGAYGKEDKATIDAKGRNFAIKLQGVTGVTIQDLKIKGWTQRGIFAIDSSDITIRRNDISGGNDELPSHGIQFQSGALQEGIVIKGNTFGKIGKDDKNTGFGFNAVLVQGAHGCEIRNNIIKTKKVNAIRLIKGSGPDRNQDCWIGGNYITDSEGAIVVSGSVGTKVWNNIIIDSRGAIAVGNGGIVGHEADNTSIVGNVMEDLKAAYATWGFPEPVPWIYNGIDINGAANGIAYDNECGGVWGHCIMLDNDGEDSENWTFTHNILDARNSGGVRLCLRIEGDSNGDVNYTSDFNTCYPHGGIGNPSVDWKNSSPFNPDPDEYLNFKDYQEVSGQDANSEEF